MFGNRLYIVNRVFDARSQNGRQRRADEADDGIRMVNYYHTKGRLHGIEI